MVSSSVEYHAGLSSGGVENLVVRTRPGSQMRLVILQLSGDLCIPVRRRSLGRRGLRFGSGRGRGRGRCRCRLFFGWWRSCWRGNFHLHFRLADLGFGCLTEPEERKTEEQSKNRSTRFHIQNRTEITSFWRMMSEYYIKQSLQDCLQSPYCWHSPGAGGSGPTLRLSCKKERQISHHHSQSF